jgi:plasmid stabilization system protein ParE
MLPVVFTVEARAEIREVFDWYEARRPGLGETFIQDLDAVIERLADNPSQFPVVRNGLHRAILRRFPYGIFFSHIAGSTSGHSLHAFEPSSASLASASIISACQVH